MDALGHDRFEAAYFGYEFAIQGGKLPAEVVDSYVQMLSSPGALPGSLGFDRAFDATVAQNVERKARPLAMPVLATGGEDSHGEHVGEAMQLVADEVFLAPHRDGSAHDARPQAASV